MNEDEWAYSYLCKIVYAGMKYVEINRFGSMFKEDPITDLKAYVHSRTKHGETEAWNSYLSGGILMG